MSIKDPKIGLMLGPHFGRMASSFGLTEAYFYDSLKGHIPKPASLTGVSSGSLVCATFAPWIESPVKTAKEHLINLTGSDFFSLNKDMLISGGVEALAPLMLFVPWDMIKNRMVRNLAKGMGITVFLGMEYKFVQNLFNARSIFSNERLRKLLLQSTATNGFLYFDDIFSSDIKVDIVSANINGDKERDLSVAPHIVTNYKPEHQTPEVFVDGIVRSTSITAFFPTTRAINNEFTTDGGIYGAFPIEIPYNHGCDVIVIADFKYAGQGYLKHDYTKFMSALHRSVDIIVDTKAALVIRVALGINNDLVQIEKMKTAIKRLENIAEDLPPIEQGATYLAIDEIEEALKKLTAYDKRFFNLVVVKSPREIPEFNFRRFDSNYLRLGIEIGQEAYFKAKEEIYEAVERAA